MAGSLLIGGHRHGLSRRRRRSHADQWLRLQPRQPEHVCPRPSGATMVWKISVAGRAMEPVTTICMPNGVSAGSGRMSRWPMDAGI